jgi:hypothetical protein
MLNIVNLAATIILFYGTAHFIGNVVSQKLTIGLSHSASIGLILISTISTYYAYLKIDFKWLAYFFLVVVASAVISQLRNLRRTLNYTNEALTTVVSILITTPIILFFLPLIKKYGLGVHSVGNLDPLMFGLIAKHVEHYGFDSRLSLQNFDLGFNATWNWTGTQTLLASFSSLRDLFPYENGSTYIAFVATLFLIMGKASVKFIVNQFDTKPSTLLVIVLSLMITIGMANQVNLFMIANGFLAQLLFASLVPEFINSLSLAWKKKQVSSQMIVFTLVYGGLFSMYFAGAIILLPITVLLLISTMRNSRKRKKSPPVRNIPENSSKHFTFAAAAFIITSFPALNFLKIYGLSFLSSATPTWNIPSVNVLSLIPGMPICQPIGDNATCSTPPAIFGIIFALVMYVFAIIGFESTKNPRKFEKASLQYLIFGLMAIASLLASHKYQYWKIFTIIQLMYLTLYIPYWSLKGLLQIRNINKRKITVKNSVFLVILVLPIVQSAIVSSNMWNRSIWSYYTTKDEVNLKESQLLKDLIGVNIQGIGSELMKMSYFAPTKNQQIIGSGSYFTPGESIYKYTLINKNQEAWINSSEKISINETYGLVE